MPRVLKKPGARMLLKKSTRYGMVCALKRACFIRKGESHVSVDRHAYSGHRRCDDRIRRQAERGQRTADPSAREEDRHSFAGDHNLVLFYFEILKEENFQS